MTTTTNDAEDRRARRSVSRIKTSFLSLMREKGFSAMTIRDIADRADVNRSTFYAHFEDKHALLAVSIREKYMERLNRHLHASSRWTKADLRKLILATLEHFQSLYGQCSPSDTVDPLFERVIREELAATLGGWLAAAADADPGRQSHDVLVLVMSWAIFGAAVEWYRRRSGDAAERERLAEQTLAALLAGAGGIALPAD